MLSSAKPDKAEAKFAARLDVLTERVDTLASTVATTASGLAKKDGEIATLRKELDARDERLADFVTKARAATGGTELIELKEAVAALAKEHSKGGGSTKQLDDLVAKVGQLGQRMETLSTTVSTTASALAGKEGELAAIRKQLDSAPVATSVSAAPDPAFVQRVGDLAVDMNGAKQQLETLAAEVGTLRFLTEQRAAELEQRAAELEQRAAELDQRAAEAPRPSEELREMLVALHTKVEQVAGMRSSVNEEQLEQRFAQVEEGVSLLSDRVDSLGSTVEAAVSSLSGKEHELAALNRHFTESSTRIESVVRDIRDALSAFSELGPPNERDLTTLVEQLVSRIEKIETATREASTARDQSVGDVGQRIDLVEQRVAAVATEVAHAKTLWPVALRSLEARLDDVASHDRRPSPASPTDEPAAEDAPSADDDLVASLRDSLHAMENVAAEMARASDALGSSDDAIETETQEPAVAAGGANVVPLRADT
jgi:chromosome segregation ATPase